MAAVFGEVPMSCTCPCVGGSFAGTYDFWAFAVLCLIVRPLERDIKDRTGPWAARPGTAHTNSARGGALVGLLAGS